MNIITLDFETYFDDEYTLSKMTTEAYIRDTRFEAHGCAVKWRPDSKTVWIPGDELGDSGFKIALEDNAVLCHHGQFDGLILSHHYDIKPKFWFDTLSMARLLLGNHLSVGLDSLAKHFALAAKTVPYNLFKGKHWHELHPAVQKQVADGAIHDVELTWQLFNILGKNFPREEFDVIDSTVRLFTEPCLRGDIDLLGKLWLDEEKNKTTRLADLNVSEADLQSADRFAQLLRDEGVEPELKEGKNKQIYAFAKTDQFMRDLLEDDNDRIRALAEARLGVKSTILQTRAETLGWMARRGPMPVYLRYAGAHTTRDSGGDGANWQNFKRTDPENPKQSSPLRRSIMAPEGFLLAPVDLSQIEARLLNYLAGQEDVIQNFREGKDPYVGIASQFYGRPITKDTLEYHVPDDDERAKLAEFKWDGYWRFRTRNGWTDLYHTKFVENVIQWLARVVMMQAMLRIKALGYRIVMRTHDELVVLIPKDGREQQHLQICMNEMKRTPNWLPGIPLDCEGSLGERYSK